MYLVNMVGLEMLQHEKYNPGDCFNQNFLFKIIES